MALWLAPDRLKGPRPDTSTLAVVALFYTFPFVLRNHRGRMITPMKR